MGLCSKCCISWRSRPSGLLVTASAPRPRSLPTRCSRFLDVGGYAEMGGLRLHAPRGFELADLRGHPARTTNTRPFWRPVRGPPGAGLEFSPHMSWPRNLASLGGCDLAHARATEIATIPQLRRRRRSGWSSCGLTRAAPRAGYADDHLPTEPLGCAEVNTPEQIIPDPTEGLWADGWRHTGTTQQAPFNLR